jgi:hypothetical protein
MPALVGSINSSESDGRAAHFFSAARATLLQGQRTPQPVGNDSDRSLPRLLPNATLDETFQSPYRAGKASARPGIKVSLGFIICFLQVDEH